MNLDNWQVQLRKGLLELVVINLLSRRKLHGYQMVQILKRIQGLSIREGNIYPILARLQMDGLVASSQERSPDGPPRKYFNLTEKGKTVQAHMNTHWDHIVVQVDAIRKETPNEHGKKRLGNHQGRLPARS